MLKRIFQWGKMNKNIKSRKMKNLEGRIKAKIENELNGWDKCEN